MPGSLTIRRALLALPDRTVVGDVLVEDGVIAQVGPSIGRTVGEEVDAEGRWLLPGAIDTLATLPLRDAAAVRAATSAALAKGVTSMLLDDRDDPPRTREALRARLAGLAGVSAVHFGVYVHAGGEVGEDGPPERTPGVRIACGHRGPGSDPTPEQLEAWLSSGDRPVVVDGSLPSTRAARSAVYEGAEDAAEHARIHTPDEIIALWDAVVPVARKHGRDLHLVAAASEAEVRWLAQHAVDADGVVTAGVLAPHLFLRDTAIGRMGTRAVCDPPLRGEADQSALWSALREGTLSGVASGHHTVPAVDKDVAYPDTPGGMPMASSWFPLLLDRAVRGELGLPRLVRWTSEAPARRFGLPRLGRIEVGFDGDLVLVDPEGDLSLAPPKAGGLDWSPFAGFTLRGRPVMTILRGEAVWRDGVSTGAPGGRELGFTA